MYLERDIIRKIYTCYCKSKIDIEAIRKISPEYVAEYEYLYNDIDSKTSRYEEIDLIEFFDECYADSIGDDFDPKWLLITNKKDPLWGKIPYEKETFIYRDLYTNIKITKKIPDDFEKYCKLSGLMAINKQYRDQYKKYIQMKDVIIPIVKDTFVIKSNLLTQFITVFRKDPRGKYWPISTHIIPLPELRAMDDYPLVSPIDILKIDYIASFIYDTKKRTEYLQKTISWFFDHKKADIKQWLTDKCEQNETYKQELARIEKIKLSAKERLSP